MVIPHGWVRTVAPRRRAHAMSSIFVVLLSRDGVQQMFWCTNEKSRSECNARIVGPSIRPRVSSSFSSCPPTKGVPVVASLSQSPLLPLLTRGVGGSLSSRSFCLHEFVRIESTTPPVGWRVALGTGVSRYSPALTRFSNKRSSSSAERQRLGPVVESIERQTGPVVHRRWPAGPARLAAASVSYDTLF